MDFYSYFTLFFKYLDIFYIYFIQIEIFFFIQKDIFYMHKTGPLKKSRKSDKNKLKLPDIEAIFKLLDQHRQIVLDLGLATIRRDALLVTLTLLGRRF
jgi:hypothetical protein